MKATKAKTSKYVLKYQGVEYPKGYVIAKCANCGDKKTYDMASRLDHMPMCNKCFMPMIAQKVVVP